MIVINQVLRKMTEVLARSLTIKYYGRKIKCFNSSLVKETLEFELDIVDDFELYWEIIIIWREVVKDE